MMLNFLSIISGFLKIRHNVLHGVGRTYFYLKIKQLISLECWIFKSIKILLRLLIILVIIIIIILLLNLNLIILLYCYLIILIPII